MFFDGMNRFSEPIRNETLDCFGQSEKLKCSLASPSHLLSLYDSRLNKIKIYDFRFLTVRSFIGRLLSISTPIFV